MAVGTNQDRSVGPETIEALEVGFRLEVALRADYERLHRRGAAKRARDCGPGLAGAGRQQHEGLFKQIDDGKAAVALAQPQVWCAIAWLGRWHVVGDGVANRREGRSVVDERAVGRFIVHSKIEADPVAELLRCSHGRSLG